MANLYIGLLHYPMENRQGDVVTTSMTSMDVHDIARSARTFGVSGYYVITPLRSQREIARRIRGFWTEAESKMENTNRGEALELVLVLDKLEESILDISDREGREPLLVGTSARDFSLPEVTYGEVGEKLREGDRPIYVLFGTGWGMTKELLEGLDFLLPPVEGSDDFNHLSVRAAAAIILDRIRNERDNLS